MSITYGAHLHRIVELIFQNFVTYFLTHLY